MNKNIITVILFTSIGTAFGVIFGEFRSWDNLATSSSDIVIARCTATPEYLPPGTPSPKVIRINTDGVIESDIEIIGVLKGNTKPGLSKMDSWYIPYQGETFAVFANYITYQSNSWYNAIEGYRIVPLNRDFKISDLDGKTLNEQIKFILASRLKDLDDKIARDKEEKKRLEKGLSK